MRHCEQAYASIQKVAGSVVDLSTLKRENSNFCVSHFIAVTHFQSTFD